MPVSGSENVVASRCSDADALFAGGGRAIEITDAGAAVFTPRLAHQLIVAKGIFCALRFAARLGLRDRFPFHTDQACGVAVGGRQAFLIVGTGLVARAFFSDIAARQQTRVARAGVCTNGIFSVCRRERTQTASAIEVVHAWLAVIGVRHEDIFTPGQGIARRCVT